MGVSYTSTSSSSTSTTHSNTQSQSQSQSQSETIKILNQELVNTILSGLMGNMTDAEIAEYAENLLKPQLNAGLEEAQQTYEATKLAKEQEIENLVASLGRSLEAQQDAYNRNRANVETAALARGMGRSSHTIQSLVNQGNAYAKAVQDLTGENTRLSQQIQNQISLAARQNAQTQGRLKTDYAASLAAKIQELRQQQRQDYNQNYLTAVSGAMGQQTTGTQNTTGTSTTDSTTHGTSHSTSVTVSGGGGGGGGGSNSGYNS